MDFKVLHKDAGQTTYLLVFATGDEVILGLTEFADAHDLAAAHLSAIGAFREATLGYFDIHAREYLKHAIAEQVEVVSLAGNVARDDGGRPKIHAHAVLGRRDANTYGGHLLAGWVRPTLEVILVESPPYLRRRERPDVGLALIDLADS
jgi:predicted DNA-binding protein with PD1-like motif